MGTEIRYTTPVIKKGTLVCEGNKPSKAELDKQAENKWEIEYYFEGKRVRLRPSNINRIKDRTEKEFRAEVALGILKAELANGFNPFNKEEYEIKTANENLSLDQAIKLFFDYHKKIQSRLSTIQSYQSKLNHLSKMYPNKQLNDLTTKDLENFVYSKIESKDYTNVSVKIAKKIFKTFFNVLIEQGYYHLTSPMIGFDKNIKSFKSVDEIHIPYSPEDAKLILKHLRENDHYGFLFCTFIYETCLRPSEIKGLKIKDANLFNNTITVNPDIKKVTNEIKKDIIPITPVLRNLLLDLKLEDRPLNDFLMGNHKTITSATRIGKNAPYNRLIAAFKQIDKINLEQNPNLKDSELLINKGYDLYSWKHFSNIHRFNNGWKPQQIMVLNRHSDLQQTIKYMRNLKNETDISGLDVPILI